MAGNKLAPIEDKNVIGTLGAFTRDELARFRDYILSSYFNNKGPLLEFLEVLLPMISKGKAPTGPQLLKLLLKTARLSTATYRSLLTDLSRLVQSFLQNEIYRNKPEQAVTDLLTAVNAKRLNKLFDINMSLARKVQTNVSGRSAAFYLREFVVATENDLHKALSDKSDKAEAPEHVMARLDEFYIINKLRYSCESRHLQHQNNTTIDEQAAAFMVQIDEGWYPESAPVKVYAAIYRMLNDEEEASHFTVLKQLLKTQQRLLPEVILRDAYVFAINYCVRQVNRGKFNYLRDVYELYKNALDRNFLYDEHELSPWDYSSIMALGVQLRDYKWSEKIIEVYKERVPTAGKKMNVITFNMAKMYFFSGRYREVLQLLEGVTSDEPMYMLGMHALLIKTYYEMDDKEALAESLENLKKALKQRRKITSAEKKSYVDFITLTKELMHIPKRNKKEIKALKQELVSLPATAEYDWLIEKLK